MAIKDTQILSERAVIGRFYSRIEQGAHPWANDLSWDNPGADQGTEVAERYPWLGQAPVPREFVGPRQTKQLRVDAYEIRNKRWETSLEFPLQHWNNDKTGQIMVRVDDAAARYETHKARLLSQLIIAGESTACYDGQYFFDTDHAESGSAQSNDLSVDISALPCTNHGSTAAPSAAEMALSIMQGVQSILGFRDDQGEPVNEEAGDFRVLVPATLWMTALTAVGAKVLDSGSDNPAAIGQMDGLRIRVHSNARLSWTDRFAIFRADGQVKPFIFQSAGGVKTKLLGPDSEYATVNDRVMFTADAENNAGYGDWKHACLVTMT